MLTSELLDKRLGQRYLVTQKLLDRAGIDYRVISAHGSNKLSQMLELVMFGDYVSYYLALLNQTDPYPLDEVDYLKSELLRFSQIVLP
jgi:glucose/mannose-6-phosphate isomerase